MLRPVPTASRLVAVAEASLHDLAREMVTAFVGALPIYAELPSEQVQGEIQELCRTSLRTFFATLREERPPSEDELVEPRASAARRAEEQVPLDAVLAAYHLGARIGWDALGRLARPDEQEELLRYAAGVLTYLRSVTGAVAAAYLDEQQAISGEVRDAQRALAQALLDGTGVESAAERAGAGTGGPYAVVAFALAAGDPHPVGVGERVAARRRQRRVQEAFDRVGGGRVPGLLGPDGGVVVLRERDRPDPSWPTPAQLAASVTGAAGRPATLVITTATDTGAVPEAGSLARELLDLVGDLGRPAGGYQLADLLLDYQLSRPSLARGPLAALLEPVLRNPDFLPTLQTWLACDQDRREAASRLHVHPNTLDYRLRRIGELTGVDPASGAGAQLLGAAVAARRFR